MMNDYRLAYSACFLGKDRIGSRKKMFSELSMICKDFSFSSILITFRETNICRSAQGAGNTGGEVSLPDIYSLMYVIRVQSKKIKRKPLIFVPEDMYCYSLSVRS